MHYDDDDDDHEGDNALCEKGYWKLLSEGNAIKGEGGYSAYSALIGEKQ